MMTMVLMKKFSGNRYSNRSRQNWSGAGHGSKGMYWIDLKKTVVLSVYLDHPRTG